MTYESTALNDMLDRVKEHCGLRTDKELAAKMRLTTGNMSKVRHEKAKFGPAYQIKVLELTGWTLQQMREFMGVKCKETSTG